LSIGLLPESVAPLAGSIKVFTSNSANSSCIRLREKDCFAPYTF
jgi:hypothetical protein